jgi:cyanophycinase
MSLHIGSMKWTAGYRRAVALCAVVLGCGLTPIDAGAAPGKLVVVGGGKIGDEIRDTFIELAGGKGAKLLIVPQASGRPDAGERNAAPFIEKGMTNVSVLSLEDSDAANAAVANASAIWFGGGAQNRLMERLEAAGVVDLIRKRHQSGVVMGGSSAGAAVMSEVMIAGDTPPIDQGLALWPEAIVDQHFVERKRFNRSLRTVLSHPGKLGVGIGESTAVVVDPAKRRARVIGAGAVTVIDAREAKDLGAGEGEENSWKGVRLQWLRAGADFEY